MTTQGYRAWCLACTWRGRLHTTEVSAEEEAVDHDGYCVLPPWGRLGAVVMPETNVHAHSAPPT